MKIEKIVSGLGKKLSIPLTTLAVASSLSTACKPCSLVGPDACQGMPPTADNIHILPEHPQDGDTLYLVYTKSSDGPVQEEINWIRGSSDTVKAAHNQRIILPEYTSPNEIWRATILLKSNGYVFSFDSPSVKIGN